MDLQLIEGIGFECGALPGCRVVEDLLSFVGNADLKIHKPRSRSYGSRDFT